MENLKAIEALLAERESLRNELANMTLDCASVRRTNEIKKRLSEIARDLLEAMPALVKELSEAREALRWRKVEDELPEKGIQVEIVVEFEVRDSFTAPSRFETLSLKGRLHSSGDWLFDKFFVGRCHNATVFYWRPMQPLPSPPQQQQEPT